MTFVSGQKYSVLKPKEMKTKTRSTVILSVVFYGCEASSFTLKRNLG
jgi:hypothetical protein